jgi:hypothetical protein
MFKFNNNASDVFQKENITMEEVLDDENSEYSMNTPSDKCKEL